MTKPCILCCAITGSLPTKANNPAVPISIAEQVESSHAAFEAGASIIHCHVRADDDSPTSDPDRFALLKEGQRDLRQDNLSIRNQIHSMQGDINGLRGAFAQMDQRLDRIENRLELRELAEAQARFEPHP